MASSERALQTAVDTLGRAGTRTGTTGPMGQHTGLSLRDHESYISLTMEFRCNLKCVHCMIEGTMDRLEAVPDAEFEKICADQSRFGRWKGLVLTGSEITLRRDLPDIARKARAAGFKHIRIQTHGMHLGRPDFADRLIDAGIDEFFVSVAGADAETHDEITQVKGSWDKMMKGLDHLDHYDQVKILTNSVITEKSYKLAPGMVRALDHLKHLTQMEFWVFFPMAHDDPKGLIPRLSDVRPYLIEAISACRQRGRYVEVKNFPECLLGNYRDALVNAQPTLFIDPKFWAEFDKNGFYQCPHQAECSSQECLGLTGAYIGKYGDERDKLSPL
ncbi:MAG: radical SAM protein [Pseudomonadota bacterium]